MKRKKFVSVFKIRILWHQKYIYTRNELVMMETFIADFHTNLYILWIQKLVFRLPEVCILGANHCGNAPHEAFKRCSTNKDVSCCRDYSYRVVDSFSHQIQSWYYGVNVSLSIEGIVVDHFSAPTQTEISVTLQAHTHHAVFHSFFSGDIWKIDGGVTNTRNFMLI